jgi:hypothetical protein
MCVGRMPPSSTKISVVARVASKGVDLQQRAHNSFRYTFFARPAHQTALAPWTHVSFAGVQKTHFRTSQQTISGISVATENKQATPGLTRGEYSELRMYRSGFPWRNSLTTVY